MRNSYKAFFSSKFPKFQVVKFNPKGHNSPMRLNFFSNINPRKDSSYNGILLPTFDNKSFYSNFTYKYFNLKWKKFEQRSNYNKYVKTPAPFPNFLVSNNYFSNAFLNRRKKRRVYKRRKIRYTVYFKNRFLRSTKSIFRAYRLRPFYDKKKAPRTRKELVKALARKKKSFKALFRRYWVRKKWRKFPRHHTKQRFTPRWQKKFTIFNKPKPKKPTKRKFYFGRRRPYKLRVFRFFNFKKSIKKIKYARRYAYRCIRRFRKIRKFKPKPKFWPFQNKYQKKSLSSRTFKFRFFKRLAKRVIKRRYFLAYIQRKLKYRIRSRIFENKFGTFRFLGFRDYLLQAYFKYNFGPISKKSKKSKKSKLFQPTRPAFFDYFFTYPQKVLYSKRTFYFKFFTIYNILKSKKLKRFITHFNLNFKQYYYFYSFFRDFFSIVSVFKLNFISFNFKLFKKTYSKKFVSRISALQYMQRRKLVRNLRFCTYFILFTRITQLNRGTEPYRHIIKKFIKFIYRRVRSGRMLFFLPFLLNKFIYFGLISHVNSNIYMRDPIKFNEFYSTKTRRSKFIIRNKI